MAISWNTEKDGPVYTSGFDYFKSAYTKSPHNSWTFTKGIEKHTRKKYNDQKYWKQAYKSSIVEVYYVQDPKNNQTAFQEIHIVDHYGENIPIAYDTVHKAMMELSEDELEKIVNSHDKHNYISLQLIKYCIKNALICFPLEEII